MMICRVLTSTRRDETSQIESQLVHTLVRGAVCACSKSLGLASLRKTTKCMPIAFQSPETTHGSSTNSLDMVLLLEQIRWNEQRPAWQQETPGTAKDTDMSLTAPNECRSWQGMEASLKPFLMA